MTRTFTRALALGIAAAAAVLPAAVGLGTAASQGASPPRCAGHAATIVGNAKANHLHGTPGRDVIVGLGGNDEIEGRGGNDIICGGRGNDELEGDRGNDRLYGGPGFDEAEGGPGHDVCVAEEKESC
jgi:Ca2+-binding RTX toxin-like protein